MKINKTAKPKTGKQSRQYFKNKKLKNERFSSFLFMFSIYF